MMSNYPLPQFKMRRLALALLLPAAFLCEIASPTQVQPASAQSSGQGQPLYLNAQVQEYNAKTQVATSRGNVQMSYPARGIQATAAQAQYFTKERRIVFSGNVYILQKGGNSIKADVVTYLIDEGRFVAAPQANHQVESTYIVNDTNPDSQSAAPVQKKSRSK
ncbi:MAG: LptA/OstA family protein [Rhizonema sp. PD38]|nr:LptA/OstA family protein [Rhizonema sp. PD38]